VFNLPAGSPGLGEALSTLYNNFMYGNDLEGSGKDLGREIKTKKGTTRNSADIHFWANQVRDQLQNQPQGGSEVLGIKQTLPQQYEPPIVEAPYSESILSVPQIQERTLTEDIVVDDETIQKFVNNAKKWAGTVSADPNLTYRQKETVKENAEYVGKYVEAVMRLAPYFNLPPKTMASMVMQESGFGGQRFDGNLGGYGFLDSGEDMGIRFEAPSVEEQAAKYLEKVASDWEGRYQGSRSPQDFYEKGYNPHADYPSKVMGVYKMLGAQ